MRTRGLLCLTWILILAGCGEHQIGASKEAFRAVDALYTAVGLRDPKLLDNCDRQLKALRESGELSEEASQTLDTMIDQARSGAWEPAQERLSRFMEGQRR